MKKIGECTFIEPAIFGFKNTSGKLQPFYQRLSKDEKASKTQLQLLEMQLNSGAIVSVDFSAGYVQLSPSMEIPGSLDKWTTPDRKAILQFINPAEIADAKANDVLAIYEIDRNNTTYYQLSRQ